MSFEPNAIYFARRAAEEEAIMRGCTCSLAREAHRQLADLYSAAANLNDNCAYDARPVEAMMPARHVMQHLP